MPLTRDEAFYIEEYKSLREEMTTKLKDRLEFNRWGMIGLGALYSDILSNPKPALFFVPILLSAVLIYHLYSEHVNVVRIATYIRKELEPWFTEGGAYGSPNLARGWENHLGQPGGKTVWFWSPLPAWYVILLLTIVVAGLRFGCPSLFLPAQVVL